MSSSQQVQTTTRGERLQGGGWGVGTPLGRGKMQPGEGHRREGMPAGGSTQAPLIRLKMQEGEATAGREKPAGGRRCGSGARGKQVQATAGGESPQEGGGGAGTPEVRGEVQAGAGCLGEGTPAEGEGCSRTTDLEAARARCAGVAVACMGWVDCLRQGGSPAKGFTRVAPTPLLPTPRPSSIRLLCTFLRPTVGQEGKIRTLRTLQATPLDTNHPPAPPVAHCPSTRLLRTFLSSAAICTGDTSCGRKAARRGTCTAGSSWAVPLASLASKGACT